ncbi:hypothetical protein BDR26DRAFT_931756 [Obelidium mucronatum]|nr:hypothetical protein BDR26DRAFT_931756 [Obelidium mucronatum]
MQAASLLLLAAATLVDRSHAQAISNEGGPCTVDSSVPTIYSCDVGFYCVASQTSASGGICLRRPVPKGSQCKQAVGLNGDCPVGVTCCESNLLCTNGVCEIAKNPVGGSCGVVIPNAPECQDGLVCVKPSGGPNLVGGGGVCQSSTAATTTTTKGAVATTAAATTNTAAVTTNVKGSNAAMPTVALIVSLISFLLY